MKSKNKNEMCQTFAFCFPVASGQS